MRFFDVLLGTGGEKERKMDAEADCAPISGLSSVASSVVHRCARLHFAFPFRFFSFCFMYQILTEALE
jgi:hypothetical protein